MGHLVKTYKSNTINEKIRFKESEKFNTKIKTKSNSNSKSNSNLKIKKDFDYQSN